MVWIRLREAVVAILDEAVVRPVAVVECELLWLLGCERWIEHECRRSFHLHDAFRIPLLLSGIVYHGKTRANSENRTVSQLRKIWFIGRIRNVERFEQKAQFRHRSRM